MKTYEPTMGEDILISCQKALILAVKSNDSVCFNFNGVDVTVNPKDSADSIFTRWNHDMEVASAKYRESPQYKADQQWQIENQQKHQSDVDRLILTLPQVIGDSDKLMGWLEEFTEAANCVGIKWDKSLVLKALKDAGYESNMHVGHAKERYSTPKRIREYVIGQVIECISNDMPPHPIIMTFIREYFKLALTLTEEHDA